MAKTIGIQLKLHINQMHWNIEKHVSKLTLKENMKQTNTQDFAKQ